MKRHLQKLVRVVRKQSGQSLVEYALILALIAVVAILVLQGLGGKVNNTLSSVNANLPYGFCNIIRQRAVFTETSSFFGGDGN